MAISIERANEAKLVAWACQTYGFETKQFHSSRYDPREDKWQLAFTPRRLPPDLVALANKIHDVMNDELRGAVVRAAVPDLSAHANMLADLILNPKMHVVDISHRLYEQITKS